MVNFREPPRRENKPTSGTNEQALSGLTYLWKIDDPEWVSQREVDWQILVEEAFDDFPKTEKKLIERYFRCGEKSEYIPVRTFFFLTPYDSAESLLKLFNSRLLNDNDRASMYSGYIFDADRFANCRWYRQHTSLFVEGILGDTYSEVIERTSPRHTMIISPPPTLWCNKFVRYAIKYVSNQVQWKPLYQCVNYFISALPYALYERDRKGIKLPRLLQLVTDRLSEGSLSGELLVFVQELKDRELEILQAWDVGEQKIAAMKLDS